MDTASSRSIRSCKLLREAQNAGVRTEKPKITVDRAAPACLRTTPQNRLQTEFECPIVQTSSVAVLSTTFIDYYCSVARQSSGHKHGDHQQSQSRQEVFHVHRGLVAACVWQCCHVGLFAQASIQRGERRSIHTISPSSLHQSCSQSTADNCSVVHNGFRGMHNLMLHDLQTITEMARNPFSRPHQVFLSDLSNRAAILLLPRICCSLLLGLLYALWYQRFPASSNLTRAFQPKFVLKIFALVRK